MKRLAGIALVVLLAACGGSSSKTAAGSSSATSASSSVTSSSSSADFSAYCAVMKRTDQTLRAHSGLDAADLTLAIQAENERAAKSPPELTSYWRTYMGGGRNIEAVQYLQDWTYTNCGFEPKIG